jgi:hypothetical protein
MHTALGMAITPTSSRPVRRPGETKAMVKKMHKAGHRPRDIAAELGISTQAVYQHLAELRERKSA